VVTSATDKDGVNMELTWTSKKAWGSEGSRSYYAKFTSSKGDQVSYTVDQPNKRVWAARGWVNGRFAFYKEGSTMSEMKAACQTSAQSIG
jgi:hypothetical protein